ncbi:U-box domain-containing protein [Arachis hypogaea]|nr:U-box domain-containing protein [Arachis hypogaea]
MDSGVIFLSLRRRKLPSLKAFLVPVDLSDEALIRTVVAAVGDLVTAFSDHRFLFQRKNSHSLILKIEVFQQLLESLRDSYVRALLEGALFASISFQRIFLDYCAQLSKLWLLPQNLSISGHFHDLGQEFSTLLDVFPVRTVDLSNNVREQIEF